jgi:hypothetical protein
MWARGEEEETRMAWVPQVDKTGRLVHTSNIRVNRDAATGLPGQPYTYYSIYARA